MDLLAQGKHGIMPRAFLFLTSSYLQQILNVSSKSVGCAASCGNDDRL
jgi:hypothetical protein